MFEWPDPTWYRLIIVVCVQCVALFLCQSLSFGTWFTCFVQLQVKYTHRDKDTHQHQVFQRYLRFIHQFRVIRP